MISNNNSLSILCIGDPHFKINNKSLTDQMTEKTLDKIKTLKPDIVVCLGDVLHTHEKIHISPLKRAQDFLFEITKYSKLYLLIGNHDRPNNTVFLTDEHPFNPLKYWNNTTVIDGAIQENINGFNFVFCCYVAPGRFMEALDIKNIDLTKADAVFAHQEFRGVKMGYIESTLGDVWPERNPLVITGHIHDYSQHTENIIYVGTPAQTAFGESPDKKLGLFTFTKDVNNNTELKMRRINLLLPEKVTIKCTASELENIKIEKNKEYKIIVEGDDNDFKLIAKYQKLGYRIEFYNVSRMAKIDKPEMKSFSKLLYDNINEETRKVFNILFANEIKN